jgi:hypothetical protein
MASHYWSRRMIFIILQDEFIASEHITENLSKLTFSQNNQKQQ